MRAISCGRVLLITLLLLLGESWGGIGLHAQEHERYGVLILPNLTTGVVPPQLFSSMSQAGIRWGKVQFDRETVHRGPGEYDWARTDETTTQAEAHGIQVLGELGASPRWDTTAPGEENYYTYPPGDYDQWADYVFQTVNRYKSQVRYWEVWNEEDKTPPHGFWSGTPAEFARLLAVAYREIKRADPTAQVLIGGFLAIFGSEDFFRAIMSDPENPADQHFDIMNIHAYFTAQEARDKVIFWRSMTSKPLWVTEVGWPSDPDRQQSDPQFCCGEEAQASFLRTVMPELVSLGAEKVFWYALWVPENPWGEFDTYTLLDRASFAPKPAYVALSELVAGPPPIVPNLVVSPESVQTGGTITASWSGIPGPTPADWLGLYLPGADDGEVLAWLSTTGEASGTLPFDLSPTLAPGPYELRLFGNGGLDRLTISNSFTLLEF